MDYQVDTRKGNSGRTSVKELSLEEKFAQLEAVNNILKAENELLKKITLPKGGWRSKSISGPIHSVIQKYQPKKYSSYLFEIAGV
jgi:hypothetical protein